MKKFVFALAFLLPTLFIVSSPSDVLGACNDYTTSTSCGASCGGVKADGTSYFCKWLSASSSCVESANPCGGAPSTSGVCPAGSHQSNCLDHYNGNNAYCDCYSDSIPLSANCTLPNQYATCESGKTDCVGTYACTSLNLSPSPTPYCATECTTSTSCKLPGNCSGGTQGGVCGYTTTLPRTEKYDCTQTKCVTTCTTPAPPVATRPPIVTPSPSPIPTSSPTPTPVPITAQCVSTKIYSPNWTLITSDEYFDLLDNSQVYFCTAGSSSAGAFDMARFTINNVLYSNTSVMRPGSNDFCQIYTIPAGSYTTTVQGEVHHNTLGWL